MSRIKKEEKSNIEEVDLNNLDFDDADLEELGSLNIFVDNKKDEKNPTSKKEKKDDIMDLDKEIENDIKNEPDIAALEAIEDDFDLDDFDLEDEFEDFIE
ncbi:TPA: hypothetical protein DEG21_05225 [Patescibacteria group bacterium]|nr:hypothetical protein [Candidatus Gracilibacteria bacterium]HBY75230.1 hypothetical protein [Candidatus Gracilibacteria bacterium]